jgi:hypothetical protein
MRSWLLAIARADRQSTLVVEIVIHPETPCFRARSSSAAGSPEKSGNVRWQWVSITGIEGMKPVPAETVDLGYESNFFDI